VVDVERPNSGRGPLTGSAAPTGTPGLNEYGTSGAPLRFQIAAPPGFARKPTRGSLSPARKVKAPPTAGPGPVTGKPGTTPPFEFSAWSLPSLVAISTHSLPVPSSSASTGPPTGDARQVRVEDESAIARMAAHVARVEDDDDVGDGRRD
jgi:hypothetical protein